MSNILDFFRRAGGSQFGTLPVFPDPIALSGTEIATVQGSVPYDGTFINRVNLPIGGTSSSSIIGFLDDVQVWAVVATDFLAAGDGFGSSYWLDDVNGFIWAVVPDGVTSLQFGKINLEDGTLTKLGSPYVITGSPSPNDLETVGEFAITRPAVDSGDFTFHLSDRTVDIDEGTGVATENLGVGLGFLGDSGVGYVTADLTAGIRTVRRTNTIANVGVIIVANGSSVEIPVPPGVISSGVDEEIVGFTAYGTNRVALLAVGDAPNFYSQIEIDIWIKDMARYGGIIL